MINTNAATNTFENNNFALVNEALKNFDTPLKTSSKVCLQREELAALTGNDLQARILSQIIYRVAHRYDLEEFLNEETRRRDTTGAGELYHGWIRLAAWELKKETLSTLCEETMRRHVLKLIKKGYLYKRDAPIKYDRGKIYRLNLRKVVKDLYKLGYSLSGLPVPNSLIPFIPQPVGYIPLYSDSTSQLVGYIPQFVGVHTDYLNTYCNHTTTTQSENLEEEEPIETCCENLEEEEPIETCEEQAPTPLPEPDFSSSSIDNDDDELIFDHALTDMPEPKKAELKTLVKGSEKAQELLDELNSAVIAGQVKKSPVAYLKGILKRDQEGLFNPTSNLGEMRRKAIEVATSAATTNNIKAAIEQCELCDENGIIYLINSQDVSFTTNCPHDKELIKKVNKEKGFRLVSERNNEAVDSQDNEGALAKKLKELINKKKLN